LSSKVLDEAASPVDNVFLSSDICTIADAPKLAHVGQFSLGVIEHDKTALDDSLLFDSLWLGYHHRV